MIETTMTPFQAFLNEYKNWALLIEVKPSVTVYAFDASAVIRVLRDHDRGMFRVALRIGKVSCGAAELTKLISGRIKENKATRACVGIAAYYNESLWGLWQQESEVSSEPL